MQGHILKHGPNYSLVFFFPGYTNEIPLPNLGYHLYKCRELTIPLQLQDVARRSSVSGRITRSRSRHAAMEEPQQQPPPYTQQSGWVPTGYASGWDQPPQHYEAGGSAWQSASSGQWAQGPSWYQEQPTSSHHSSSSSGLSPSFGARRSYSARGYRDQGFAEVTQRMSELDMRTTEIQDTLNQHVQETHAWQQQTDDQLRNINATLQQGQSDLMAYFRSQGFNPYRGP